MSSSCAQRSKRSLVSFGISALLAISAATAQVVTSGTGIDDSGMFQKEVQACQSGRTQQDRDTCMREARNAQAERQSGRLSYAGELASNAAARCEPLAGEERAACQARVLGYGSASGSVAGGGILREVETVVLPPGQESVTIEPKTSEPVVLVPVERP